MFAMRISKKSRYGVRMMLELALEHGNGYIFLKEIARRQEISEKYLSQIVLALKSRGLVASSRGAKGGHMLSRAPSEISVREIVEALEGDPGLVECVRNPSLCGKSSGCPAAKLWRELEQTVSDKLGSATLAGLLQNSKKRNKKNAGTK
jgi:Rrf2 family protein